MSKVIHGTAHKAIKHFRKFPAALSVFMIYVSRTNIDNVAWPSLRGLKRDTEWSVNTCASAKQWLVECKAIIPVENYIRPQWRGLPENELKQRLGLDKAQYFSPTGTITIDGTTYPMLYAPINQESEEMTDVSPGTTSVACDIVPDDTELNTSSLEGDSIQDQEPTQSAGPQSKFGYTIGDTAWWVDEKDYRVTLRDGKVTRFTAKMVEFTYVVDGKEYSTLRKPNSLSKTQPILRRKTTPLQDMIALNLFNIEPNVAVGKELAIRLNRIEGEIRTSYPNLTALDFKFACAFAGKYIPRDTPKVLAMIGDFYKTKNGNTNTPQASTTTAHETRTALGLVDA